MSLLFEFAEMRSGRGEGGEGRKPHELLTLWNALAWFQVVLMKKSAPCRVQASLLSLKPWTLPSVGPFLPPSASSSSHPGIAFCIVVPVSISKMSPHNSLCKALHNDNIYRRLNKICIKRLIVNKQ